MDFMARCSPAAREGFPGALEGVVGGDGVDVADGVDAAAAKSISMGSIRGISQVSSF